MSIKDYLKHKKSAQNSKFERLRAFRARILLFFYHKIMYNIYKILLREFPVPTRASGDSLFYRILLDGFVLAHLCRGVPVLLFENGI